MDDLIGKIDIDCPTCNQPVAVSVSDIANQRSVTCRRGHRFSLIDKGGKMRQVERANRDFEQRLRRLGE